MSWLALLSLVYFRIFFLAGIDNTPLEFWSLIISNVELFYILFGHFASFWGCLFTSIIKWLFSVVMGQILALVNWGKDETESQTMLLPCIFAYSWFLDIWPTHPILSSSRIFLSQIQTSSLATGTTLSSSRRKKVPVGIKVSFLSNFSRPSLLNRIRLLYDQTTSYIKVVSNQKC